MIERIMEIMRNKGFNSSRFAEEIGIQRAAMSHILNGRNNVSLDVCKKILEKFPEISVDWLLFGKGEMMRVDVDMNPAASSDPLLPIWENGQLPDVPSDMQKAMDSVRHPIHEKTTSRTEKEPLPAENKQKKIDKIIIFYSDHTFETFLSEKEKKE